jgi:hypothetical protein
MYFIGPQEAYQASSFCRVVPGEIALANKLSLADAPAN